MSATPSQIARIRELAAELGGPANEWADDLMTRDLSQHEAYELIRKLSGRVAKARGIV